MLYELRSVESAYFVPPQIQYQSQALSSSPAPYKEAFAVQYLAGILAGNSSFRTKKPLQSSEYKGFKVCLVPVAGMMLIA